MGDRCCGCSAGVRRGASCVPCGAGAEKSAGRRQGENDLLRRLRECEFAVIDAALYRDLYPASAEAEEYLARARAEHTAVAAEFENRYGGLTVFGPGDAWCVCPWKYEAN